jgi:hypothetical protein
LCHPNIAVIFAQHLHLPCLSDCPCGSSLWPDIGANVALATMEDPWTS